MSDATDQSELKRKFVMVYNAILGDIEVSHNEYQNDYLEKQKDKILRLAKILDESGHPQETICAKVSKDISKYDIKERYVRQILPEKYKRAYNRQNGTTADIDENKDIEQSNRTDIRSSAHLETKEQKQPLIITNNGETVDQIAESALDEIYGGKSFSQMEKEARREVEEDKEETLENPNNGPRVINNNNSNNNIPLLSDTPPEIREKLARFDEMEQALQEQKAIADQKGKDFFNLKRAYTQLRSGSKDEELTQLKNNLSNLQSELAEIDKESLEREFKFKEIEVLKIHPDTVRLLTDVSRKSQRTLFLIVHPKTMMIKGVKTDVQMHMTQARRNVGLEV